MSLSTKNSQKGFFYTVTDEQIEAHRKRSVKDIFRWIESTNKFVHSVQNSHEHKRKLRAKDFEF